MAKLQRIQFGRKSEKLALQIAHMELRLEDLQAGEGQSASAAQRQGRSFRTPPNRKPLPPHLPREEQLYMPEHQDCPSCGGKLTQLGEDVSEQLEYVPASFRLIRHVRPKLACSCCDCIVQACAPSRPIERGLPGPGLLAHVLVAKFSDHLPLYRQSAIYAREGVELPRSLLADWVGACSDLLAPLVDAIGGHVCASSKLHADDTPLPVLAPGLGKTKTARLWTYVRDDRPSGSQDPPAGMVRLHAGSQRCSSSAAPQRLYRGASGRCVCRVQCLVRVGPDQGGSLLGARQAQVLRIGAGKAIADY